MFKYIMFFALVLWGCEQASNTKKDKQPSNKPVKIEYLKEIKNVLDNNELTEIKNILENKEMFKQQTIFAKDIPILQEIAVNAMYEAVSEDHEHIEDQIYSVINRANNFRDGDIIKTIRWPKAYSWKITLTQKEKDYFWKHNKMHYQELYKIAVKVYYGMQNGTYKSEYLTPEHDHYITLKLAVGKVVKRIDKETGKKIYRRPPIWFRYWCDKKTIRGAHVFCEGMHREKGERATKKMRADFAMWKKEALVVYKKKKGE